MDRNKQLVEPPFARHQKTIPAPAEIALMEYLLTQHNEQTTFPEQLLRYLIFLIAKEDSASDIHRVANEIRLELNDWHIQQLRAALWRSFT